MQKCYLLFRQNETMYGLEAPIGVEIIQLPELKTPASVEPPIAGYINFHGSPLPVIDAKQFLGSRSPRTYQITEQLVLIPAEPHSFGVIIDEILDIKQFDLEDASPKTLLGESEIIFVLSHQSLQKEINQHEHVMSGLASFTIDPDDKTLFKNRALEQKEALAPSITSEKSTYLLIRFGKDLFGVEVSNVCEIIKTGMITPLPRIPEQVRGVTNLRGSSVLVLDLKLLLSLGKIDNQTQTHIMVVNFNEKKLGLLVEEICDFVTFEPTDFQESPSKGGWCKHLVNYMNDILAIIDIDALLQQSKQLKSKVD